MLGDKLSDGSHPATAISAKYATSRQCMVHLEYDQAKPLLDPRVDPLVNPRVDPRSNPRVDPRVNPRVDPRDVQISLKWWRQISVLILI